MSRFPRWMFPLCLASLLWGFSFNLGAPLASLWLRDADFSKTVIGLNTSTYYLGIALTAPLVPFLMRRWSHQAVLIGMIGSAVSVALFPWAESLTGWFLLRAFNGVAGALSLIPLETYVNRHSTPQRRAENFGYYAFCIALGMALGTVVGMRMYTAQPHLAFGIGGVAALLGGVVILLWKPGVAEIAEERHQPTPLNIRRNFLSYGSAWSQGFLEGGMVSLLPVYLLWLGLSHTGASNLMSGVMIGVIVAQVPVAWLADRYGRNAVLLGCYAMSLLGLGCLLTWFGVGWLAVWLFAVGACSGAFYPLGLALLGERMPAFGLARANAWFLAINCIGSLTGPFITGRVMDRFGNDAMFLAGGGALLLVLVMSAMLLATRSRTVKTTKALPAGDVDDAPVLAA